MRKIDKKKNLVKANLLAEQRYLESKGIITESYHDSIHGPNTGGPQKTAGDIDRLADTIIKDYNHDDLSVIITKTIPGNRELRRKLFSAVVIKLKAMGDIKNGNVYDSPELGWRDSENTDIPIGEVDGLSSDRQSMKTTADYPWIRNVGNHQKADEYEKTNTLSRESFLKKFKETYFGNEIETNDGIYTVEGLQFRNNHGNYNVILTNSEDGWPKTLRFSYNENEDNYYLQNRQDEGIEILGDSQNKLIEMLRYNK
jgi:hypothetical protein